MNKFLAILLASFAVATVQAQDSFLWWLVSDKPTTESNGWDVDWDNARLVAINGGESHYLNLYAGDKSQVGVTTLNDVNAGDGSTESYYGALITSFGSGYTYFLEVYNSDGGWVGKSENGLSYSDASQYISLGGTDIPSTKFDFGTINFTAAPEPNSAMLLLLGLSALALRRKQKKA